MDLRDPLRPTSTTRRNILQMKINARVFHFLLCNSMAPSVFSMCLCRVVDGVELLAHILHPNLVETKAPDNAVLKLNLKKGQRCRPWQLRNFFEPLEKPSSA